MASQPQEQRISALAENIDLGESLPCTEHNEANRHHQNINSNHNNDADHYGENNNNRQDVLDRELGTRDRMIVGLILAWGGSLSTLATGAYIIASGWTQIPPFLVARSAQVGPMAYGWMLPTSGYLAEHRVYPTSKAAMTLVPLLFQLAISCISGCLDSIHSTTLRWSLWREGRLRQNTNLRLFTCSRDVCSPNGWPANLVSALGLILAYGGATAMTFPVVVVATIDTVMRPGKSPFNFDADFGPDRFGIDFNAWGLVGLGIGLFLQAAICTWCLVHKSARYVETWNSNALATAKACRRSLVRKGMSSAGSSSSGGSETVLHMPVPQQPSMRELVPASRKVANWIWTIFAIYATFTVIIGVLAARFQNSTSLEYVRKYQAPVDFTGVWKYFGQLTIRYGIDTYSKQREWVGLLFECLGLSTLLFGLHLADSLGGVARDEALWRRATSARGASLESNLVLDILRSWPSCVIFAYKSVIPWVLGYGFTCISYIFLAVFPILTVTLLFLTLGLLAEYLIRVQPKGSQPSTYGGIQTLVALVDDWDHHRLFWGDKGTLRDTVDLTVRLAGTAGQRLGDLQPGVRYKGLDSGSSYNAASSE